MVEHRCDEEHRQWEKQMMIVKTQEGKKESSQCGGLTSITSSLHR